ncbi:MAG: hypothetical protein L0332_13230 [Chloroflexi bacterium]|nr:hypothetical protein [Chloroflexota bacterium]MCI0645740.1 hypothetical protein [Chloroflexota bacterium]MCI0727667.1 hypothetical protein [Chloroflexota bacterium]
MKEVLRLLAVGLLAILLLVVLGASGGGSSAYASDSVDYARFTPEGGILLADQLPVAGSESAGRRGGTWTVLATMNQAVKQVNGGGYGLNHNFIFIPGGVINTIGPLLHDKMQHYEISTNRWRTDPQAMPVAVADAAICTDTAGKVHVINGFDSTSSLVSVHQIYDTSQPIGSRWTTAAAPVVSGNNYFSQGSGCAVINHILYLFGGYGVIGGGTPAALGTTWAYNPNTNTWTDTGFTMNVARYWAGFGQKINISAHAAGGTDGSTTLDSTEKFTPGSGWTAGTDLPLPLLAPGLVGTDNGVMVFGGGTPVGPSFVLQVATYTCAGGCGPLTPWNNASRDLNTARWFAGYAGGPPEGPFIAGGHVSGNGSLKSSERFQLP